MTKNRCGQQENEKGAMDMEAAGAKRQLTGQEFEVRYNIKGKGVLDGIFGEFAPDRNRVMLKQPKREREVVLAIEYETPEQYKRMLQTLCEWLGQGDGFGELEDLMLY
jgi:hypothetical protein